MKRCAWIVCLLLIGCATTHRAPVIDRAPATRKAVPPPSATKKAPASPEKEKDWRPDSYTVKKGDTLYSIGLEFGFDHKEIAQWNNIQPPYVIYIGQQLKLKEPPPAITIPAPDVAVTTPLKTLPVPTAKTLDEAPLLTEPKALKEPYSPQAMAEPVPAAKPAAPIETAPPAPPSTPEKPVAATDEAIEWSWPVNGKVLAGFNDAASAKGVDIAGSMGQPVYAAASGKVVYSGAGLRGYGKLIIIKHNKTYLSAYAHNSQLLVKEGQAVAKGQKIAEMGNSDTDQVKLHFEIRKLGKPVDPVKYLPANPG